MLTGAEVRKEGNGVVPRFVPPSSQTFHEFYSRVKAREGHYVYELLRDLKNLESSVDDFRTVRSLSEWVAGFFQAPPVSARELREEVFSQYGRPLLPDDPRRAKLLSDISGKFGVPVVASLFSDIPRQRVVSGVPSEESLRDSYNRFLFLSLLMNATELFIRPRRYTLAHSALVALGAYYRAGESYLYLQPPVTRDIAEFVASLVPDSSLDGKVVVSWGSGRKKEYPFRISSLPFPPGPPPQVQLPLPPSLSLSDSLTPLVFRHPGGTVYVNISHSWWAPRDRDFEEQCLSRGEVVETVYRDASVKGHFRMQGMDFQSLERFLKSKYSQKVYEPRPVSFARETEMSLDDLREKVGSLYPDSDAIITYIESQGLSPSRVLPLLGYRVKWDGLSVKVFRE